MIKLRKQKGYSLIELMVVLSIMMAISIVILQELKSRAEDNFSKAAAVQMDAVGQALQNYIAVQQTALAASPVTDVTIADLIAGNHLPAGFATTNIWSSPYSMRVRRIGTAAPYSYEALITTLPYIDNGVTRIDIVGAAVNHMDGPGGMSYDATTASGRAGSWTASSASYPAITAAGQLSYLIGPGTTANLDGTYLRIDGGNAMSGTLNMGGNALNNATNVSATGVVTSGSVSSGNISSTGTVSAASVATSGAVSAGSVASTGGITGASLASSGTLTVSGNATVNGAISTDTLTAANDVNISSLTGYGHGNTSLRDHASRYFIVETDSVADGDIKTKPTCPTGASPRIYIMMRSALRPNGADPDLFNGTDTVANDMGTYWIISMKDAFGNSLTRPENAAARQTAIVWIACVFGSSI